MLKPFRGLREKLSRLVWPFLVANFTSVKTFKAISQLCRSSKPFVRVEGNLRTEVLYWRFLDDWKDCFPWRSELHGVTVSLFSDASTRAWGAVLFRDGRKLM